MQSQETIVAVVLFFVSIWVLWPRGSQQCG